MTETPTDLQGCLDLLPDNTNGAITAETMRAIVTCLYGEIEANRDSIALNRSDLDSVKAQADETSAGLAVTNGNMDALYQQVQNVANVLANLQIAVQANADAIGALQGEIGWIGPQLVEVAGRVDALDGGGS